MQECKFTHKGEIFTQAKQIHFSFLTVINFHENFFLKKSPGIVLPKDLEILFVPLWSFHPSRVSQCDFCKELSQPPPIGSRGPLKSDLDVHVAHNVIVSYKHWKALKRDSYLFLLLSLKARSTFSHPTSPLYSPPSASLTTTCPRWCNMVMVMVRMMQCNMSSSNSHFVTSWSLHSFVTIASMGCTLNSRSVSLRMWPSRLVLNWMQIFQEGDLAIAKMIKTVTWMEMWSSAPSRNSQARPQATSRTRVSPTALMANSLEELIDLVKYFKSLAVQALFKICSLVDYFLFKGPGEPKKLV